MTVDRNGAIHGKGGKFAGHIRGEDGNDTLDLGLPNVVLEDDDDNADLSALGAKSLYARYATANLSDDEHTYTFSGLAPRQNPRVNADATKLTDLPGVKEKGLKAAQLESAWMRRDDGEWRWSAVDKKTGDLVAVETVVEPVEIQPDDPEDVAAFKRDAASSDTYRMREISPAAQVVYARAHGIDPGMIRSDIDPTKIGLGECENLASAGYRESDDIRIALEMDLGALDAPTIPPERARVINNHRQIRQTWRDWSDDYARGMIEGDLDKLGKILDKRPTWGSTRDNDIRVIALGNRERGKRYKEGIAAGIPMRDLGGNEPIEDLAAMAKVVPPRTDPRKALANGYTPDEVGYGNDILNSRPAHLVRATGLKPALVKTLYGAGIDVAQMNEAAHDGVTSARAAKEWLRSRK